MPLPAITPATVTSAVSRIYYGLGGTFASRLIDAMAWRPPQWNKQQPALTIAAMDPSVDPDPSTGGQVTYVFDGTMRADHDQESVITLNPVQSGAPIADHAYVVPSRLTVELLMSDAMQSYTSGQFAGGASRSVSAYQLLKKAQKQKWLLTVTTRLASYDNMVITSVHGAESPETRYGAKFSVTFTQILTASVEAVNTRFLVPDESARPQATENTNVGQLPAEEVPDSITTSNEVPVDILNDPLIVPTPAVAWPVQIPTARAASVPAAGRWSSIKAWSKVQLGQ